jgi:hypothetical protein
MSFWKATDNVAHQAVEPCSRVLGAEPASLTRRRLTRTDVQENSSEEHSPSV